MATKTNIHVYTGQTPNGIKSTIALEELGLQYEVTAIDISKNTQKEQWFLDINPNGRIPSLTDTLEDGTPVRLFESGSLLLYLVDRYDKEHKLSYPHGTKEYYETLNWLFWQVGGLGPMQGQANHFVRYAPEKIQYGINRYTTETRRLYGTIDTHLAKTKSDYLVGDRLTIADIASWPWVASHSWAGVEWDDFPHLKAWFERVLKRPGVEKGRNIPSRHTALDAASPEELEKRANAARDWIQKGMADDAQKFKK